MSGIKWVGGAGADAQGGFGVPGDVDFSQPSFGNKNGCTALELYFLMAYAPGQGMMSWVDQKEQHGGW